MDAWPRVKIWVSILHLGKFFWVENEIILKIYDQKNLKQNEWLLTTDLSIISATHSAVADLESWRSQGPVFVT